MHIDFVAQFVNILAQGLTLLILVTALLSYVMPPNNPVRSVLDQIVDPMLNPIRRILPPLGGLDLSPMILIILVQLVAWLVAAAFN